jgi:surface protein
LKNSYFIFILLSQLIFLASCNEYFNFVPSKGEQVDPASTITLGFTTTSNSYVSNYTQYPISGICASGPSDSTIVSIGGDAATKTTTCTSGTWSDTVDVSASANGPFSISITQDSNSVSRSFVKRTPFVSVWRVSSDDLIIILPLRNDYDYNFTVDWGDSTVSVVTSFDDTDKTHSYASDGDYTITITGLAEAWSFDGDPNAGRIIEVVNLGDVGWVNLEGAFAGCGGLVSFAGGNTSKVTNMASMFKGAGRLTNLNVSSFDTSKVTNMSLMFNVAETISGDLSTDLTSLNISNFDTSGVTDMSHMFSAASGLTSLNLSNFDTSRVTNMTGMFQLASGLTSLDLSSFRTSAVTSMSGMFDRALGLTSLDISSFRTSAVTNMSGMFQSFPLTSLNLSHFNTANVTNMSYMFNGTSLTSINLSSFDTSAVTNMTELFYSSTNLIDLNVTGWNLSLSSGSSFVLDDTDAGIIVTCNQPGGTFFGKTCN